MLNRLRVFLMICGLAATSTARSQIPFSQDFDGSSLDPSWTLVNFNPDSSIELTNGVLNIVASYNDGGSDLYNGSNHNAPRLLQPVDTNLDWIIETKLDFAPTDNYQDAGLMTSETNGVITDDSQYDRVAMRSYYPNGGGEVVRAIGSYVADSSATTFLRVQKNGTNYTGWWSSDGVNWNLGGSGVLTSRPYLGIDATRYAWDGEPVHSSANFCYFHVLTGPPQLNIQPTAGNQVTLYWPALAGGYVLQCAPGLQASNSWSLVTNALSTNGDWIYVTNAINAASPFIGFITPSEQFMG